VKSISDSSIEVTQSRYLSTGDANSEDDSTTWWVPLNILLPNGKTQSLTLTQKTQTFTLEGQEQDQGRLFKVNAGQTGVFRVNYPIEVIKNLGKEVRKGKDGLLANAADRVGLVADAGSLAVSGEQSTSTLLELLKDFVNEDNYL
jgi:aminopeptidase N